MTNIFLVRADIKSGARHVNISRSDFAAALAGVDKRATHEKRERLQRMLHNLFEGTAFNYVEHGRQISLKTILTAFRCSWRSHGRKASIPFLSPGGQVRLLMRMFEVAPEFFAGLTEPASSHEQWLASRPVSADVTQRPN